MEIPAYEPPQNLAPGDARLEQIDVEASIAKRTSWKQDSDDCYEIVEVDNYLPKEIVDNQEKYQKYILGNPVAKTLDLLPKYPYNT